MSGLLRACDYFSIGSFCFSRSDVICFYYDDPLETIVLLSSGDEFIVDVTFDEFKSLFFS